MDSWLYGVPANNPQPPPPPPPSIQGIFPNGHERFTIDYSRNPSFGNFVSTSSAPPQIIPENNAFYYGFGPDIKDAVASTAVCKNLPEHSVQKRRREIESHNFIVFAPEVAGFHDLSAETVINRRSPTPGSKRRQTRCKCKKMCQNGHCFCFREKAGCSVRCSCNDDCRNKFNNEQGTSNGSNSAYWEKQKAAIVAELMDSDYETDLPDEMVEQYCETLKELLVAEHNGKSQKIDQDDTTSPEEKAQSSLTDAEEP